MKRLLITVVFLWLLAVSATVVLSQERCDAATWKNVKQLLENRTHKHEVEVGKLRNNANIALTLTVIVGILGVMMGALQHYQKPWTKIGITIAGGAVSLLTVINNTVFDGDHRAMNRKANQIETIIEDVRLLSTQEFNYENCQDFAAQRDTLLKLLKKIEEIREQPWSGMAFSLLSSAYAQEKPKAALPLWVEKPPEEPGKLFFVGFGAGKSLKEAEELARRDGVEEATEFLIQQFQIRQQAAQAAVDTKAIAAFLVKYAEITQKHFVYDGKSKEYTYYVLLKLDKNFAEDNLFVYAAQKELLDPAFYSKAIQQSPTLPNEYFERRRVTYEQLTAKTKIAVPGEIYAKFEQGRLLRKTGKVTEAIEVLSSVTQEHPDFYLAWYNLALAYMTAGMPEKTDMAFKKAVALDKLQSPRDASVYNSYGWFLYLNKRYREAAQVFEQALSIDPKHAKARDNLEAAKKLMRE